MTRWLTGALAALLVLCLPLVAEAKVRVVATLPTLAALAREVGGTEVDVTALALPTQDPHFVDARPHLMLALHRAQLLVATGLELESGWLPVLVRGARNPLIQPGARGHLEAASLVPLKQVPGGRVDRSMGDVHPGGNPHFLLDPRLGARVGVGLAERLAALDPEHAAGYRERAAGLTREALQLASEQTRRFQALDAGRRHVVTYHESWVYLLDWLGLSPVGTLEPKPGIAPDPAHLAALLARMRQAHADVILQEAYYPDRAGRLLAERTGSRLVVTPGGADFEGGQRYLSYLRALVDQVYAAVRP